MAQNYQLILDNIIKEDLKSDRIKKLLLHACCAPCSSYCIEYLALYYDITIYYFNPNITAKEEYDRRAEEIKRFVAEFNKNHSGAAVEAGDEIREYKRVKLIFGEYDNRLFFDKVKGLEKEPEGGKRCYECYKLRMEDTAREALRQGYDYFSTTLSISPHKNAQWLNEIGESLSEKYGISYLFSDFKKRNGFKRSIELSAQYNLYRQNFCGCIYSRETMN